MNQKIDYPHLLEPFRRELKAAGLRFNIKAVSHGIAASITLISDNRELCNTVIFCEENDDNPEIVRKLILDLRYKLYVLAVKEYKRQLSLFSK